MDAFNRIIIADHIVPRENFNRAYIKYFLKISLKDLNVKFIVTDGDVRYAHIIEELGYEQHRCTFHMMKNLMDSLSKRHSSLKRKIKRLKEQVKNNEEKVEELKAKYAGCRGRIKNDDKKRRSNYDLRRNLEREISLIKAQIRKKQENT